MLTTWLQLLMVVVYLAGLAGTLDVREETKKNERKKIDYGSFLMSSSKFNKEQNLRFRLYLV